MRAEGARLTALSSSSQDVVIDMWDVEYIDESGLGVIVYLAKRLRAAGHKLLLTRVTGQPLEYLHTLGCTDLIAPDDQPEMRRHVQFVLRPVTGSTALPDGSGITVRTTQERGTADRSPVVRTEPESADAGIH